MARRNTELPDKPEGPPSSEDIAKYAESSTDFAFEMRILKLLRELDFKCEHAGHYNDPSTGKMRQFDIRAKKECFGSPNLILRLAVETKNIAQEYPLVIQCVPRRAAEAWHSVIKPEEPSIGGPSAELLKISVGSPEERRRRYRNSRTIKFTDWRSPYRAGNYVGKSMGQYSSGAKRKSNEEIFDRMSQAIVSLPDLLDYSYSDAKSVTAVVPVIVIPNERLWQIKYDESGLPLGLPEQVDHISYFIDREYPGEAFLLSHVEVVTESGINKMLENYVNLNSSSFFGGRLDVQKWTAKQPPTD